MKAIQIIFPEIGTKKGRKMSHVGTRSERFFNTKTAKVANL